MHVRNAKILIVDNDERIVELVSWFLKKRGFAVRSANSFVTARELVVAWRPDLMLSDIDLGTENAREELPRLQAEGLLPLTLVVSGYLDPEIQAELTALAPVLDTLAKPFDFAVLEQRVLSCLDRRGEGEPVSADPVSADPVSSSAGASHDPAPGDDEGWIEITPAPSWGGSAQVL